MNRIRQTADWGFYAWSTDAGNDGGLKRKMVKTTQRLVANTTFSRGIESNDFGVATRSAMRDRRHGCNAGIPMKLRLRKLLDGRPSLVKTPLPGFDPFYYLYWYPDVRRSDVDPLEHYLVFGWREGRDPSAGFSTSGYLAANPDVAASGQNPLVHFVNNGFAEGRGGHTKAPASPAPRPMIVGEPMKLLPAPER